MDPGQKAGVEGTAFLSHVLPDYEVMSRGLGFDLIRGWVMVGSWLNPFRVFFAFPFPSTTTTCQEAVSDIFVLLVWSDY